MDVPSNMLRKVALLPKHWDRKRTWPWPNPAVQDHFDDFLEDADTERIPSTEEKTIELQGSI
jgi:hypothetical protein